MKTNLKIILLISVLLFSGCAGIPNGLKNFVAEHSDIAKDEDYSQYRQMAADGQLTEDGYFREGTESISKFERVRPDSSHLHTLMAVKIGECAILNGNAVRAIAWSDV